MCIHIYVYIHIYTYLYIYVYVYICNAVLHNELAFDVSLVMLLLKKLVILNFSQESSALRVVSADLTGKIKQRQDILELILKRFAWALRGLCVRLPTLTLIDAAFMTQ